MSRFKHDWYQTETFVVIEVRIKGCRAEDVKVEFHSRSVSLTAKIPGESSSEYQLEFDPLAHEVIPAESSFRVMATKIEIKLKKTIGVRWSSLEGDESNTAPMMASSADLDKPKYPSSSGRDWNRIGVDIEKELEDELEGEQALNNMFQKIYSEGSDEVKKAMNKSFSESGGTCLSTNWSDIKQKKVEVKAPDGMEFKKWDD